MTNDSFNLAADEPVGTADLDFLATLCGAQNPLCLPLDVADIRADS